MSEAETKTILAEGEKEFKEKVVQIRRVTKVVKGGKKMGFRAVVVVGDRAGRVGMGVGKAAEVAAAIRKGVDSAKKNPLTVPLVGNTIPHVVEGLFGANKVVLRPAPRGTGVIAGGPVRTILELSGVKDVVAKSLGSSNPINVGRAAIAALGSLRTMESIEQTRGKKVRSKYYVEPFES